MSELPVPKETFDGLPEPSDRYCALYSLARAGPAQPAPAAAPANTSVTMQTGGQLGGRGGRGPGGPPPAAAAAVQISEAEQQAIRERVNEVVERRFTRVSEVGKVAYRGF